MGRPAFFQRERQTSRPGRYGHQTSPPIQPVPWSPSNFSDRIAESLVEHAGRDRERSAFRIRCQGDRSSRWIVRVNLPRPNTASHRAWTRRTTCRPIPSRSAATGSFAGWARGASGESTWPTTTISTGWWRSRCPTRTGCRRSRGCRSYLAEARALAKLDHPNIVPVYDVGRTDDGLCYVVSKYIEGSDLAERLKQGRPSFREAVELVAIGRRGAALCPHPGPGSSGHQARQYPDRRHRESPASPTSAWPSRTRTTARGPGSPARPPT